MRRQRRRAAGLACSAALAASWRRRARRAISKPASRAWWPVPHPSSAALAFPPCQVMAGEAGRRTKAAAEQAGGAAEGAAKEAGGAAEGVARDVSEKAQVRAARSLSRTPGCAPAGRPP